MKKTMRAMQMKSSESQLELVEIPIPVPTANQVLIEIETCGICHGDAVTIEGNAPEYPRIPGHEVVGTIADVGELVKDWKLGDRVGIGFHAGKGKINGLNVDGGYAEYMVANAANIVSIPDDIKSEEASPLMCAGETTFSALFNSLAKPGDLVAIQGLGGLGHLAIQYADKFSYETVAISRSDDKKTLIQSLGANHYINSSQSSIVDELQSLGGARIILLTTPTVNNIRELLKGLKKDGQIIIVSASKEKMDISPSDLFKKQASIKSTFTADKQAIDKMLRFSMVKRVKPVVEVFKLEEALLAYNKMKAGDIQFRAVLKIKS